MSLAFLSLAAADVSHLPGKYFLLKLISFKEFVKKHKFRDINIILSALENHD